MSTVNIHHKKSNCYQLLPGWDKTFFVQRSKTNKWLCAYVCFVSCVQKNCLHTLRCTFRFAAFFCTRQDRDETVSFFMYKTRKNFRRDQESQCLFLQDQLLTKKSIELNFFFTTHPDQDEAE